MSPLFTLFICQNDIFRLSEAEENVRFITCFLKGKNANLVVWHKRDVFRLKLDTVKSEPDSITRHNWQILSKYLSFAHYYHCLHYFTNYIMDSWLLQIQTRFTFTIGSSSIFSIRYTIICWVQLVLHYLYTKTVLTDVINLRFYKKSSDSQVNGWTPLGQMYIASWRRILGR